MNQLIFLLAILVNCHTFKVEEGWKKIKVFESNRVEVEEKLSSRAKTKSKESYETDEAVIHVDYSRYSCETVGTYGQGYDLPKDTVFSYIVYPKTEMKLSELNWDKDSYTLEKDDSLLNYYYYYNDKVGIYITVVQTDPQDTNTKIVKSIRYGRTKELETKYKCKNN